MVISKISDGLGNQLFMYARGYALSREMKTELVLDSSILDCHKTRKFELNYFNVTYRHNITFQWARFKLLQRGFYYLKELGIKLLFAVCDEKKLPQVHKLVDKKRLYLKGYWQSEKYFKQYRSDLLQLLVPIAAISESAQSFIDEMQHRNSVALHVRRGDYMQSNGHLTMDFYDTAIEKMSQLQPKSVFYVFSDDIAFCKTHFAKYAQQVQICYPDYISADKGVDDLWLMSKCKHMIMANSSYSWWAAWLNQNDEKVVICPELSMWTGDFYPDEWIKIKAKNYREATVSEREQTGG